jgi:tagatose-6-phosphate ketose/aldose isomerase
MQTTSHSPGGIDGNASPGHTTAGEIYQQPILWRDTFDRIVNHDWRGWDGGRGILCGAGSSAYAAAAIQSAWPAARAVPTTDLLTDPRPLRDANFLLSLARSGDSPESIGVVEMARRNFPDLSQLAITCNARGKLALDRKIQLLLLDPRSNDRSLVMTSSFSNLVLAGLTLSHRDILRPHLVSICRRANDLLPRFDAIAQTAAQHRPARCVVLCSAPLFPWAQESYLKILEMTAGRIAGMAETYLGLRHGPMSFLDRETLVLCLISHDPQRRLYEIDLLRELQSKQLGRIICIVPPDFSCDGIDTQVTALAPELADELRTPFEIVFPQLLAYHLSSSLGLNPDNPSPGGIINRVVNGVRIH